MNDSSFYQDWLKKAADDELSLRAVLESGAPSTACFLAHQMAEKHLKALLIFSGQEFPKIHDLVKLGQLLESKFSDVTGLSDDLKRLTQYYIETRYPADYPEFTKTEAQGAAEMAEKVKDYILAKLK